MIPRKTHILTLLAVLWVFTTQLHAANVTATDSGAPSTVSPGGTINYTVTIGNTSGATATGVQFSDTLDANTTLVAGSVHASPVAINDVYNWVGNTTLDTSARGLPSLYANDVAPLGEAINLVSNTAPAHGSVVIAANGHFVYTPTAGRFASDTFTYTISNVAVPGVTDVGTVTINLAGPVWYVDNSLVPAGTGTLASPFNVLSSGITAANTSGDFIYMFKGGGNYTGGTLGNGVNLIGAGVDLVVSGITVVAGSAGNTPTITNGAGNGITLGSGNTLSGFNLGNCSGAAILGNTFGTLTCSVITINTTGQALSLTTGAFGATASFTSITSSGGANNILLSGLTGTATLGAGALSAAAGDGFKVSGGSANVSYSGSIANSAAHSVNIGSATGGTIALSGAINDTGTGISLTTNTGATINFSGTIIASTGANTAFSATGGGTVNATNASSNSTLTTTTGTALNVANTTIGGSNLNFKSITSTTASGVSAIVLNTTGGSGGLVVTGIGATAGSGGTISNKTVDAISLNSTSNVSLSNMSISIANNTHSGILGTGVNGFSLIGSSVTGNGVASGSNAGSCVMLTDTTGAVTFTNDNVSAGSNSNVWITNSPSSTAVITTLT